MEKKKMINIVVGVLVLLVIAAGGTYFYLGNDDLLTKKTETKKEAKQEDTKIDTKTDAKAEIKDDNTDKEKDEIEELLKEDDLEIKKAREEQDKENAKLNEKKDIEEAAKKEIDPSDDDEPEEISLKDKISEIENIPDEELDSEEKKLKALVKNLTDEETVTEDNIKEVGKEGKTKFKLRGSKILLNTEDLAIDKNGITNLSKKAFDKYGMEDGSIIHQLVIDNALTNKNNFEGVELKMGNYTVFIDKDYNVVKFKKGDKEITKSPILGISVFEIDDLYKNNNK